MSRSKITGEYLKKGEIIELNDVRLLNAFERAITRVVNQTNFRAKVSLQAQKEVDWVREEILQRLK